MAAFYPYGRENPGRKSRGTHWRESIITESRQTKPIMEAEKINTLAASLADLGERAREMRRYL